MAGLRTTGMLLNRLFDEKFDRLNPRTQNRALPQGLLSRRAAWTGVAASSVFFFISAAMLNPICMKLSLIPYFFALIYPFLKRWTYLCHFGIGIVLSGAPIGGWLAARGTFSGAPFLISSAVLFWVAGFDILYALQDMESDQKIGLHSIPSCFGEKKALMAAACFHGITLLSLAAFGASAHRGLIFGFGLVLISTFLIRQHILVFRHGLKRIHEAFFTLNASISIAMFLFTFADLLVKS